MSAAAATFLWYVVVAGPQGGIAVMPSPFDQQDQCVEAVKAFQATKPAANWTLQCVPGAPALGDGEVQDDGTSTDQQQQ